MAPTHKWFVLISFVSSESADVSSGCLVEVIDIPSELRGTSLSTDFKKPSTPRSTRYTVGEIVTTMISRLSAQNGVLVSKSMFTSSKSMITLVPVI